MLCPFTLTPFSSTVGQFFACCGHNLKIAAQMENGKTNTRRGKKATDESQAKFLTGERNVINSSTPSPLVPYSFHAL